MLGERVVADRLEVLKAKGFAVFHYVPCLGTGGKFNIDHVAVGKGAVAVVETKTRRKKAGRRNSKGFEMEYNGDHITWLGWKGRDELSQTIGNRDWLAKRLKAKLNLPRGFIASSLCRVGRFGRDTDAAGKRPI